MAIGPESDRRGRPEREWRQAPIWPSNCHKTGHFAILSPFHPKARPREAGTGPPVEKPARHYGFSGTVAQGLERAFHKR